MVLGVFFGCDRYKEDNKFKNHTLQKTYGWYSLHTSHSNTTKTNLWKKFFEPTYHIHKKMPSTKKSYFKFLTVIKDEYNERILHYVHELVRKYIMEFKKDQSLRLDRQSIFPRFLDGV